MQADPRMKPAGATPEAILHPGSRTLFGYWNGLRAGRPAPIRQEIDLRALAPVLPWVGIIERKARPRRHRWRLAGTGIERLWGNGLTGATVAGDWPEVYRRALVRALDGVCERRQPFVARLKTISAEGDGLGLELLATPLEAADGASVQTLCCVVPFREPYWLGSVPLEKVELTTLTALWLGPLPDEIVAAGGQPARPFRLIQGGRSD